jgi:hypothetical protein
VWLKALRTADGYPHLRLPWDFLYGRSTLAALYQLFEIQSEKKPLLLAAATIFVHM